MTVVGQSQPFISCVSDTANLWLLAIDAQQVGVNAEVNLLFVAYAREVEVIADFVCSLYDIH